MSDISTDLIKDAVYTLCFSANTCLTDSIYSEILKSYKNCENKQTKELLKNILENAKIACEKSRPLCQDTGQVLVFIEMGQNIRITGEYIEKAVNKAIQQCYCENFFRKSVVQNAIFDRNNTKTNTPAIIYTKIIQEDEVRIKVLIKGAGSENKSTLQMLLPTSSEDEIIKQISNAVLSSAENACPPMFIGIGTGYSADKAMVMSKEAFFNENFSEEELLLAEKIKKHINKSAPEKYQDCYVLDVKILSGPTHIACMPVGITINCHSDRISSCTIKNNKILYHFTKPDFITPEEIYIDKQEIYTDDIKSIQNLKEGEEFLLTGEIYVARDMAHKRLIDLIKDHKPLPFDIKNKIILYAGPCPAKINEVSGSIGPTTAGRMDKYANYMYKQGLLATIGKGSRNKTVTQTIRNSNAKYFTIQGGIAALLAEKIKESTIIAFEDLGPEAIYKIYVEKFPLYVAIG